MSGRLSRDKGNGYERELVNRAKEYGLPAQRVPLSGATTYAKGDIEITPQFADRPWVGECKRRAALPVWIKAALGGNDFLAMRADRDETLVVLRLDTFLELLQ